MSRILEITDGATTINLIDGVNWALTEGGWGPAIARIDERELGGGYYTDVEEAITLDVFGTSPALIHAKIQQLNAMMLRARQWARSGEGPPVRIRYRPEGSLRATPLEAVVLGLPDGQPVTLPATYHDLLMAGELSGVELRFLRRGAWLAPEDSGVSASTGEIRTIALPGTPSGLPSPIALSIGDYESVSPLDGTNSAYLLVTNDPDQIVRRFGFEGAGSGTVSPPNMTFSVGTGISRGVTWAIPATYQGFTGAIFVMGRIISGTPQVALTADSQSLVPARPWPTGKLIWFATTYSLPRPPSSVGLSVSTATFAESAQLEVHRLVLCSLDARHEPTLIEVPPQPTPFSTPNSFIAVDPDPLDRHVPVGLNVQANGAELRLVTRGRPSIYMAGATLACSLLQAQPPASYTKLRPGGTAESLTFTATRRKAYLTPE